MNYPSNAMVAAGYSSGPSSVSQHRDNWRQARGAYAELVALGRPRVNLMFTATDGVVENLLEALLPDLREPVGRWRPGEQLLLPPPALIGTMIFQDIDRMPLDDQLRLAVWLEEAAGKTQVVSTTPAPLFPLVEAGRFIDTLYYRLNVVSLDLTE
jgi:hypothetical protein